MSKLTLDEAIKHCEDIAESCEWEAGRCDETDRYECHEMHELGKCAAEHKQLAEWLRELKEAKAIIRVCNRVLGFLLECEIENTSTRHEVKTLLKNITEYLSGGGKNGT